MRQSRTVSICLQHVCNFVMLCSCDSHPTIRHVPKGGNSAFPCQQACAVEMRCVMTPRLCWWGIPSLLVVCLLSAVAFGQAAADTAANTPVVRQIIVPDED